MSLAVLSQTDQHSLPHHPIPDLTLSNPPTFWTSLVPVMLMSALLERKHVEKESTHGSSNSNSTGSRSRVKKLMHDAVKRRNGSSEDATTTKAAPAISLPRARSARPPLREKDANTLSAGNAGQGPNKGVVDDSNSLSIPADDEHVAKLLRHLYHNSARVTRDRFNKGVKKEEKIAPAPPPPTATTAPLSPSSPSEKPLSRLPSRPAPPPPVLLAPRPTRTPSKYDAALPKRPSPLSSHSLPNVTEDTMPVPLSSQRRNSMTSSTPSSRHHGYSRAALNVVRGLWEGRYETWVYRRLRLRHLAAAASAPATPVRPPQPNPDIFPRVGNIQQLHTQGRISHGPNPVVMSHGNGSFATQIDWYYGGHSLASIQRTLWLFDLDQRMCEVTPKGDDSMDVDEIPNGRPWEHNWELRWQVLAAILQKNTQANDEVAILLAPPSSSTEPASAPRARRDVMGRDDMPVDA